MNIIVLMIFSVVINPEDWTIEEGEGHAQKQIPTQVPESYKLKIGTCNGQDYNVSEGNFTVYIDETGLDLEINLVEELNKIYILSYGEFDPFEVGSTTLNFKDLIFLGNKKQ